MKINKKIGLDQIAKQAGVSKITVSRALSTPEKVKEQTREKIFNLAKEMGYFDQKNVAKLSLNKKKLIGIVNPNMSNPFFSQLTKAMALNGSLHNVETLIFDSYESEECEYSAIQKMIEYGVDAVILSVISSDKNYLPKYLETLKNLMIPVILVDREIGNSQYNGIYIDNFYCGQEAANYANQHTFEEVAVIAGPGCSNVSCERVRGFLSTISEEKRYQLFYSDFFMNEAYRISREYISSSQKPILFIGLNNQISLGILKACIQNGLIFNQDFSLFSIDKVPYAEIYGFNIPCITHNLDEMAYQAMSMAIRAIDNPTAEISKIIVRGSLLL